MSPSRRALSRILLAAALLCLASCSGRDRLRSPAPAVVVANDGGLLARHAPIFVLQGAEEPHNRIGAAAARLDEDGREEVYVDPDRPVVYGRRLAFQTPCGAYTNLVYRVHFPRVPLPHLTAGRNVGLLAVVTLDEQGRPALLTTVHTCGCYVAVVPTSYLPAEARPEGWGPAELEVHGESLPGLLVYPPEFDATYRPVIVLREDIHRVMDLRVEDVREAAWRYEPAAAAALAPIGALDALPLGGCATSFFETEGGRRGYVKGSHKPLERLLMSWWALDWRVGEDKRYGPRGEMGTPFYTSLKPWRREESDMWRFAEFLHYWGWRL